MDVDDTLYLERDYVRSGFKAVGHFVLERWGVTGFADLAWSLFEGGHRGRTFDDVMTMLGIDFDDSDIALLIDVYRSHRPSIALLPDARAFLEKVVGSADLGVITDGPAASQRAKIAALGLERWVRPEAVVVTGERGPEWPKPSVRAFALLQSMHGARSADCVYVADNPAKDFIAPMELGWSSVWIMRELRVHRTDIDPGPVGRIVDSFTPLLSVPITDLFSTAQRGRDARAVGE